MWIPHSEGRASWRPDLSETELHSLRSNYAALIRRVRKETGKNLHAATTVTVTHDNAHQIPSIVDWVAKNADAFRMVSFQPVAGVGRTQDRPMAALTMEELWNAICQGLGVEVNARAMEFGHPRCNIIAPIVIVAQGGKRLILETARKGRRWDESFLRRLLDGIGGFSTTGPTTRIEHFTRDTGPHDAKYPAAPRGAALRTVSTMGNQDESAGACHRPTQGRRPIRSPSGAQSFTSS